LASIGFTMMIALDIGCGTDSLTLTLPDFANAKLLNKLEQDDVLIVTPFRPAGQERNQRCTTVGIHTAAGGSPYR
jgi:hypothetical protein